MLDVGFMIRLFLSLSGRRHHGSEQWDRRKFGESDVCEWMQTYPRGETSGRVGTCQGGISEEQDGTIFWVNKGQ